MSLSASKYLAIVELMDSFNKEEDEMNADRERDRDTPQKTAEEIKKAREARVTIIVKRDDKKK